MMNTNVQNEKSTKSIAAPQQQQQNQSDVQKESKNFKIMYIFEYLADFSPLDGDNLILALFHSYVWNLTTVFVVIYWNFLASLIGIVHLLNTNLSPTVALVLQFIAVPVTMWFCLSFTDNSMNGQRRAVSLLVFSFSNLLQTVALKEYKMNFTPPPMFFAPFAYAIFVPLMTKWLGFCRGTALGGTTAALFVFHYIFALVVNINMDYLVWSAALCLIAILTFQLKVGSLRANEAMCALNECSCINLNALTVILLTMMYASKPGSGSAVVAAEDEKIQEL